MGGVSSSGLVADSQRGAAVFQGKPMKVMNVMSVCEVTERLGLPIPFETYATWALSRGAAVFQGKPMKGMIVMSVYKVTERLGLPLPLEIYACGLHRLYPMDCTHLCQCGGG